VKDDKRLTVRAGKQVGNSKKVQIRRFRKEERMKKKAGYRF